MTKDTPKLLVIDLDETLVRTDLFAEQLLRLVFQSPWTLLAFFFCGKWSIARLKTIVADAATIRPELLPYRESLLEHLKQKKAGGSRLILATAAPQAYAQAVAAHLNIFESVLSTTPERNLKSRTKLDAIRQLVGSEEFAYYGDALCDFPIFEASAQPVLVSDAPALQKLFQAKYPQGEILNTNRVSTLHAAIRALRPHQWTKNLLILLPAATSLGLYETARLWALLPSLILFCISSSIVYIWNDMGDVSADRAHPEKRRRPFAAGELSPQQGLKLLVLLLVSGLAIGVTLLPSTLWMYGVYLAANILYSGRLKEIALLDVLLLGSFYVWRILVGVATLDAPYSRWFILFFGVTFLSLAWLKRYVEIHTATGDLRERRRGYSKNDSTFVIACGLFCVLLGTIILLLFASTTEAGAIYPRPTFLVLLGIPYLYGMLDLWHTAQKGNMHHDPVRHVITSRKTYFLFTICLAILFYARFA